jgi:phospholipid-translocating ATPase
MRPIYPPSIAQTATTNHTRTQTGSDGSQYTFQSPDDRRGSVMQPQNRNSAAHIADTLDRLTTQGAPQMPPVSREPTHVSRPSFDRARMSMDRIRPSFEASRDFTSANRLLRLESSQGRSGLQHGESADSWANEQEVGQPSNLPLTQRWKRRLTRASEHSVEK